MEVRDNLRGCASMHEIVDLLRLKLCHLVISHNHGNLVNNCPLHLASVKNFPII